MSSPQPTIEELRAEFTAHALEGYLWVWLSDVLIAYVALRMKPRYSPALFSPSGQWDEDGVNDLVHGFIVDRGIKRGAILAALQQAENTAGAVRYLERAIHNYACSQRVRTIAGNIYTRLVEVLNDHGRLKRLSGFGGRASFGLDEWLESPPFPIEGEHVQEGMKFFPGDIKWTEYTTGDRQSPGLLNEDLSRVAFEVIRGSQRLWTAGQLMQLIRARFNLENRGIQTTSAAETASLFSTEPSPLDAVVAEDLARRALNALDENQRRVFGAMVAAGGAHGVRQLADTLGISKTLVNRHQHSITETFRKLHITSPAEQNQVVSAAAKLLGV